MDSKRKVFSFAAISFVHPVMPRFAEQVEVAIEALSANIPQPFEENEFIDASRLVYDGVRDIRKAVLMIRVCEAFRESPGSSMSSLFLIIQCNLQKCLFPSIFLSCGLFAYKWMSESQQAQFSTECSDIF